MKASAFTYARATSVANALELLTAHGEKAKVLSGGQSLLPAMNLRLVAPELIVGIYETALTSQELLVAVELPVPPKNSTYFFHEFARRHGDYAIVGLAAQAFVRDGRFTDLRLGFFAIGDRPLLARSAGKLVDVAITSTALSEASSALDDELDPLEDQQATATMRRHLAKVLFARCVSSLLDRPDLRTGASA